MKYEKKEADQLYGDYEAVYLKPANGDFVPCGWFHINLLLKGE